MRESQQRLVAAATIGFLSFIFCAPVFAQVAKSAATAAPTVVDFSALATPLISLASLILSGLGGVLIRYFLTKTKLNTEAQAVKTVNAVLDLAIARAEMYAKEQIANNPEITQIKINNEFIGVAVNYAIDAMPEAVKLFNLTPKRIADRIMSRLNSLYHPENIQPSNLILPLRGNV